MLPVFIIHIYIAVYWTQLWILIYQVARRKGHFQIYFIKPDLHVHHIHACISKNIEQKNMYVTLSKKTLTSIVLSYLSSSALLCLESFGKEPTQHGLEFDKWRFVFVSLEEIISGFEFGDLNIRLEVKWEILLFLVRTACLLKLFKFS